MKRGTSALIAASSRTVCVSTITSRNPCSADTTQDAHEHAGITWEALLKSTLAIVTPSSFSRSSLSRAVPWRTSALTRAPRSSKALAMRPPRLPVAPATTMVGSFIRTGKFAEAESSYQALLKTDSKLVPAQVGLVRAMLRQQKIDEALDAVNTALTAQPKSAALLAAKGDVQFRRAEMSDAESSYLTAKKLDRKEVHAYLGLARLYRSYSMYRIAYG